MSKESASVRFLYNTPFGRLLLKALVNPKFSRIAGAFLDSAFSRPAIGSFIKKHNINMDDYEQRKYKSFNDFFKRKRKEIVFDKKPTSLISPCDGYLTCYEIDGENRFSIKNSTYSLSELLDDASLAESFRGGLCLIYRLTPRHFHRYSFVDDGIIKEEKKIPGVLHCVRPVACDRYPVYVQNQREYTVLETENFGTAVQMEVGAIIVGKISNNKGLCNVKRGQEKGCFEFGGSTIIVLVKKDAVVVDEIIVRNSAENIETEVKIGQTIAQLRK